MDDCGTLPGDGAHECNRDFALHRGAKSWTIFEFAIAMHPCWNQDLP